MGFNRWLGQSPVIRSPKNKRRSKENFRRDVWHDEISTYHIQALYLKLRRDYCASEAELSRCRRLLFWGPPSLTHVGTHLHCCLKQRFLRPRWNTTWPAWLGTDMWARHTDRHMTPFLRTDTCRAQVGPEHALHVTIVAFAVSRHLVKYPRSPGDQGIVTLDITDWFSLPEVVWKPVCTNVMSIQANSLLWPIKIIRVTWKKYLTWIQQRKSSPTGNSWATDVYRNTNIQLATSISNNDRCPDVRKCSHEFMPSRGTHMR